MVATSGVWPPARVVEACGRDSQSHPSTLGRLIMGEIAEVPFRAIPAADEGSWMFPGDSSFFLFSYDTLGSVTLVVWERNSRKGLRSTVFGMSWGGRSRSSLQLLLLRMPLCILKAECLVLLVQIIEIFFPVTLTHTSLYICSQSNPEPRFLVQIETSMALVSLWQSSAPHRLRMSWLAIEKPLGFPL